MHLFYHCVSESNLEKTKQKNFEEISTVKDKLQKDLSETRKRLDEERKLMEKERDTLKLERKELAENRKNWIVDDLKKKKAEEGVRINSEWQKLELERKRVDDE